MFKVTEIVENEDGSADIRVDCDADLMKMVCQLGFMSLLEQAIEGYKNESQGSNK